MNRESPKLLAADANGKIRDIPYLEAAGMKGGLFFKLDPVELIKLPFGSRLFKLPLRFPVGRDTRSGNFVSLKGYLAVAAFISPGFTSTHSVAYRERGRPAGLPLFSYTACAFYKDDFYAAAVRVDSARCHDPRFIDMAAVGRAIREIKKTFHGNRVVAQLARCALIYGCPGAQNFFIGRYEGPLPVSPECNASCAGCISRQASGRCRGSQPRIRVTPFPEEVAEAALFHIGRVKRPVVSFGQGCEGEPLLRARVI